METSPPLKGAQGAAGRRLGWLALAAAVGPLAIYLCTLLVSVQRNDFHYTIWPFLFDYRYGVTRRGLEGEIARHLWPPPYGPRILFHIAETQLILASVLFLAIAGAAFVKRRTSSLVLIVFAAATSPLFLKEYIHDEGRQDIFGLLLAEVLVLLEFAGAGGAALALLGIAIVPLCLIADNQLFIFVPLCFAVAALRWEGGGPPLRRLFWLPLLAVAASVLLTFTLPPPRVPLAEYHAYLVSKSAYPNFDRGSDNDQWVYRNFLFNVRFAVREYGRLWPEYRKHLIDIAFFLGVNAGVVAFAASTLRDRRPLMRRYLAVTAGVVACILPIFLVASDFSRWLSNLTSCVYLLAIYAMTRFESGEASWRAPMGGIVVFQFFVNQGFGIVTPLYSGASEIVSFFGNALSRMGRLW